MLLRSMATTAVETAVTLDMENLFGELVAAKFIWLEKLTISRVNSEVPTKNPTMWHFPTGIKIAELRDVVKRHAFSHQQS